MLFPCVFGHIRNNFGCISIFRNICAVVFAFEEFERGECPGEDICSTDCQPDAFMDMSTFLLIGGVTSMAMGIINTVVTAIYIRAFTNAVDLAVSEGSPTDTFKCQADGVKRLRNLHRLVVRVPMLVSQLAWAIAGFVLYSQVNDSCTETGQAKMVLAWCILVVFFVFVACNRVAKPKDLDATFAKVFSNFM